MHSLGLHPEHNLAEVAPSHQVDATTIKLFLTPYDPGLYVLCGARTPAEADVVTHEHVSRVIPLLAPGLRLRRGRHARRSGRPHAVGAGVRHGSADGVGLDVTSIRSLRKAVDAMDALNITKQRHFVLNRADAKVGINPADAAEAVGWPIESHDPVEPEIPLSMNVGTPVVKLQPRSAVAKQIVQLSHLFAPADGH